MQRLAATEDRRHAIQKRKNLTWNQNDILMRELPFMKTPVMKLPRKLAFAALAASLGLSSFAYAVPVLQVGAPASGGNCANGPYEPYQTNTVNPTETDTAITSGNFLCVAGVYQNKHVQNLGGQFGNGYNWSAFGFPAIFDNQDAILLASVPEGLGASAASSLTIDGNLAFYNSATMSFFPNLHDPVKDSISDFLFFGLLDFQNTPNGAKNFADPTDVANGEIKTLAIGGTGNLPWIHFDLMALETLEKKQGQSIIIRTTWENNPGSHDVTWKNPGSGPPTGNIPEPGMLSLLSVGLLGMGLVRRRRPA